MSVLVLLSTYNGQKYLEEQLISLQQQKNVDLSVLVRDDGSHDDTTKILKKYAKQDFLDWYSGNNIGPAYSFFNLMENAPKSEFYAFCDQDDIWKPNKLYSAIKELKKFNNKKPALYFSKAQLYNQKLKKIDNEYHYPNESFELPQALLGNNATGCTMVFNERLLKYVNKYEPDYLLMHDHWLYLLCLALDGNIKYDKNSYIKYRQHDNNVCGNTGSFIQRFKNSGFFDNNNIRSKISCELLKGYEQDIPKKNVKLIKKVCSYNNSLMNKFSLILDSDIKKESFLSNILLIVNILFNKL